MSLVARHILGRILLIERVPLAAAYPLLGVGMYQLKALNCYFHLAAYLWSLTSSSFSCINPSLVSLSGGEAPMWGFSFCQRLSWWWWISWSCKEGMELITTIKYKSLISWTLPHSSPVCGNGCARTAFLTACLGFVNMLGSDWGSFVLRIMICMHFYKLTVIAVAFIVKSKK